MTPTKLVLQTIVLSKPGRGTLANRLATHTDKLVTYTLDACFLTSSPSHEKVLLPNHLNVVISENHIYFPHQLAHHVSCFAYNVARKVYTHGIWEMSCHRRVDIGQDCRQQSYK